MSWTPCRHHIVALIICGVVLTVPYLDAADKDAKCRQQPTDVFVSNTSLVSLADNTGVTGSFIWGSGYVDSYPVFAGYTQTSTGSYKIVYFSADASNVYQDLDGNTGYVIERKECQCIMLGVVFPLQGRACNTVYDVHVPKDSIIRQFKLDSSL